MKQFLAILELQGLINIIKQLDINTDLNKYKQIWKALNYLWGINCCFELSLGNKLPENQLYLWKFVRINLRIENFHKESHSSNWILDI